MSPIVFQRVKIAVAVVIICGFLAAYCKNNVNRITKKYEPTGVVRELGDFGHFYYAAVAMADHEDIYKSWTGGYIYPPLIAFLYLPLASMSESQAAYVLTLVYVIFILLTLWVCGAEYCKRTKVPRDFSAVSWVALLGMLLVVDKIKGELQMWQTNSIMVLMFALGLRWLDRRPTLAGAALGVIFNIKYLSIGFLPYLIIRRRWTAAISFVFFSIFWAILPATVTGLQQNKSDLRTAFGGLLHMTGTRDGSEMANVEDVKDRLSCSITSAFARGFGDASPMLPVALTATTAAVAVGVAMWMYRANRVPIFMWPDANGQQSQPFRTIVGVEWAALVAAALAFSPQTNTRHLVDAIIVSACIASLIIFARKGVPRWPVILAAIILFCGFHLPPGDRTSAAKNNAVLWWVGVGGPCWCLLTAAMLMIWTGLKQANAIAMGRRINLPPLLQPISSAETRGAVPNGAAPMNR